ncbi:hypothetical protein X975_09777, partial [Stegodyphus mimosarum]
MFGSCTFGNPFVTPNANKLSFSKNINSYSHFSTYSHLSSFKFGSLWFELQ